MSKKTKHKRAGKSPYKYVEDDKCHTVIPGVITPASVIDRVTGEPLTREEWSGLLIKLIILVHDAAVRTTAEYEDVLTEALQRDDRWVRNPQGYAWQLGITPDTSEYRANGGKVASRFARLVNHMVISTWGSFVRNTDPCKKEPYFPFCLNLGAVDSEFVRSTVYDAGKREYAMSMTVMCRELTFYFTIPEYVTEYDVKKFCNPVIRGVLTSEDDPPSSMSIIFDLSLEENVTYHEDTMSLLKKRTVAGYDCGVVKPFSMLIRTEDGRIIARYNGSRATQRLNLKRNRLRLEKKNVDAKLATLQSLGILPVKQAVLQAESDALSDKITALGKQLATQAASDIRSIIETYHVSCVYCEDLSWVSEVKGTSSWNYSDLQSKTGHVLKRAGARQHSVSAAFTSKTCEACGSMNLTYNTSTRVLTCLDCSHSQDRDTSAASIIARKGVNQLTKNRARRVNRARARRGEVRRKHALMTRFLASIIMITSSQPYQDRRPDGDGCTSITLEPVHVIASCMVNQSSTRMTGSP